VTTDAPNTDAQDTQAQNTFVPEGFEPPAGLVTERFRLEPLGPHHNPMDLEAWTSSIDHIQRTPGFEGRDWPARPFSLEENLSDLDGHAADFVNRTGFTYTVLDPADLTTIGCVYLYPPRRPGFDVDVRSWVRATRAELDGPLHDAVSQWLVGEWPCQAPDYAPRS
jgi:hypothetical protein